MSSETILREFRTSITYCITFKMSHILKIYKTLLRKLNVLKGSSSGISISAMGVIRAHLKTPMEKNYSGFLLLRN